MTERAFLDPRNPDAVIGGVDAGICDQFQVVWPSDVDRFKAQIDPLFDATDDGVAGCPGLSAADRASWKAFHAQWKLFAARETPTFGSSNEREQACAFSRTLDGWRDKLAKTKCAVPGPDKIETRKTEAVDLARLAVYGAAIVGGVAVLALYAPEIKGALRALGAKK